MNPTDRSEQRETLHSRTCPLCEDYCLQSQHPRHRLVLEDEAATAQSRIVTGSVCPTCWDALYVALVREEATAVEFLYDANKR
jgi:hypothetical protein